jgi:hypothetical protein
MTDDKRYRIPLDSPLDFNSEDMLVPLNKPKFTFNRQRYLGSLLQTSVRYEDDGYFAGWWNHQFESDNYREDYIDTKPDPFVQDPNLRVSKRFTSEGYVYNVSHLEDGFNLVYTYNVETSSIWVIGTEILINRTSDIVVHVEGKTRLENKFEIDIDPYTGEGTNFKAYKLDPDTEIDDTLIASTEKQSNILMLNVYRNNEISLNDYVEFRLNNSITINDINVYYEYKFNETDNKYYSIWGNYFRIFDNGTTLILESIDKEFELTYTFNQSTYKTETEYVSSLIYDVTECSITYAFEFVSKWVSFLSLNIDTDSKTIKNSTIQLSNANSQNAEIIYQLNNDDPTYNNYCIYKYMLPIWIQHKIGFRYFITFYMVADPNLRTTEFMFYFDKDITGIKFTDIEFSCINFLTPIRSIVPPEDPDPDPPISLTITEDMFVVVDSKTFKIVYTDMPRYTVLDAVFKNNIVVCNWQPYKNDINPDFNKTPSTCGYWYKPTWGPDRWVTVPYGCTRNPNFYDYRTVIRNIAKFDESRPLTEAEINLIRDVLDITYTDIKYIQLVGAEKAIENLNYKPEPVIEDPENPGTYIFDPDYDPRPVIEGHWNSDTEEYEQPVPGDEEYKRLYWSDVSIPDTRPLDEDEDLIDISSNYNISPRYFIEVNKFEFIDWNPEPIQTRFLYWNSYWPSRSIPHGTGSSIPINNTTQFEFIDYAFHTEPDPFEESQNNQPIYNGVLCPPLTAPSTGSLNLSYIDKTKMSSVHGILNDSYDSEGNFDDVVKSDWEWALRIYNIDIEAREFWRKGWIFGSKTWFWEYYYYYHNYDSNKVHYGNVTPPLVWKSFDESFSEFTVYNQGPIVERNEYDFKTNSIWILYLRCKNKNTSYPIPSSGNNEYFTLELHCNGNFRTSGKADLNALSEKKFIFPHYITNKYNDNYKVLNENISPTDNNIWNYDSNNGNFNLNIPLCVAAYSFVKVEATNILNSNKSAFTLSILPTNDPLIDTYAWRFDDENTLNLTTKPTITNIQNSSNQKVISITYNSKNRPMYYADKELFNIENNVITSYMDEAYPLWIKNGTGFIYYDSNIFKVFFPSEESQTVVKITAIINELNFVNNIEYSINNNINSQFNSNIFNEISPSFSGLQSYSETEHSQTIELKVDNSDDYGIYKYNPDDTTIDIKEEDFDKWEHVSTIIDTDDFDYKNDRITIKLQNKNVFYNVNFKRTFILDKKYLMEDVEIKSQIDDVITLNDGYGKVVLSTDRLIDATEVSYVHSQRIDDTLTVFVGINNSAIVYIKPIGIINKNSDNLKYINTINIENYIGVHYLYKGIDHRLYIDLHESAVSYVRYLVRDIHKAYSESIEKEVYRRDTSDIYMFVKQFWSNTVDTENYWIVDSTRVLELTKFDLILLKKNVDNEIDAWNGDKWDEVNRVSRSEYFGTDDLYYSVSSSYNTNAVLFKLQHVDTQSIKIKYIILDETFNITNPKWKKDIDIIVEKINFGSTLSIENISSYQYLDIDSIITTSKISSTFVDNNLIIGIAYNRGLCQWTIKIKDNGDESAEITIVNGYGHVGVNGSLTGGQIPINYCDSSGFIGTVQTLESLPKVINDNQPTEIIVGTESTQWFVSSTITGIVTHLTYSNNNFIPVSMNLNNNYEQEYESASGAKLYAGDIIPRAINLADLLGDQLAIQIIARLITPNVLIFNPLVSMIAFIGHSIGQYSYVWRNSTQNQIDDKKTDKDIIFGKKSYEERFSIGNEYFNIFIRIVLKSLGAVINNVSETVINKARGEITTDDSNGRKLSQFFEENLASSVASEIQNKGFNCNVSSKLIRIFNLNMFYSINDKTQCWAGPGFVNHNLQAQCISQSITDTQLDAKQGAYWTTLIALTKITVELQMKAVEYAHDQLQKWGAGVASSITGALTAIAPTGLILATAMFIAAAAMEVALALNKAVYDNLDSIGNALGGYPDAISYINNASSSHSTIAEGTHSYGNKSMSMFWPAFGINKPVNYTNEVVEAGYEMHGTYINFSPTYTHVPLYSNYGNATLSNEGLDSTKLKGNLNTPYIKCKGVATEEYAPANMAVVEGTTRFLSKDLFKNEQIGVSPPVFGPPPVHDYMIDKQWQLGFTAAAGEIISVSCDDTKILDGPPSNIIVTDQFCAVASSYAVIEIKNTFDEKYLRPTLVTPNTIGLNINRINCVHEAKAYHAFDGQMNRIVKWTGSSGMDKELLYQQYLFQINDHFKRSNILPPSQFMGSFNGPPSVAIRSYDQVANLYQELSTGIGTDNNIPGEQKNLSRFSIPVHSETLSSLPAVVRMLAPYKLHVVEGITSLTTDVRTTQTRYKAPSSVDFNINGELYRQTEEFVCEVKQDSGINAIRDIVASAGLTFLGATTKQAFFYSPATRLYYSFSGGRDLTKQDILNRFIDVKSGRWDFVNQEVIFEALLRNDETVILRMDEGSILGEVWPPNETIYNRDSGFKIYSVAGGLVFQGPKRNMVSRFTTLDYMIPDIIENKKGKWTRVNREEFNYSNYNRKYSWYYPMTTPIASSVKGWTHNPWLVVTAMLGQDEETDCKYEWIITFAWTQQMDKIYENDEYAVVNIMAETITQGGTVSQRPSHIFLNKTCFTREGNAGYYTYKFQSNNGIGNRERLYMWSDAFIALEDLSIDCKNITKNRTQPLQTQVDIQNMREL